MKTVSFGPIRPGYTWMPYSAIHSSGSQYAATCFGRGEYSGEINKGIGQLRTLYPDLRPARLYFTVGVFKTGGTTLDSLVLIGSEISMVDHQRGRHYQLIVDDGFRSREEIPLKPYPIDFTAKVD